MTASDILLADAVITVSSPSSNWPSLDRSVTSNMSDSESGLLHKGCSHEPLLCGVAVLGTDPRAGARVLVEEAEVVAVGAVVSGTADVDPQAMTTSMIARQDVIRTLFSGLKVIAHKRPFTGTNWGTRPFRKLI
jgi:hypothetical protein